MKLTQIMKDNWRMKEAPAWEHSMDIKLPDRIKEAIAGEGGWLSCTMPSVAHEVLLDHQRIDADVLETGIGYECAWVSDKDWIFETRFAASQGGGDVYLDFKGLDSIVDIWMNGAVIGRHETMFMPCRLKINDSIKEWNQLVLYFHSPNKVKKTLELPDHYTGRIGKQELLRKAHGDFSPHGGAVPYVTPIGAYDDIVFTGVDRSEITYVDIETEFDRLYEDSALLVKVHCSPYERLRARVRLIDPDGNAVMEKESDSFCAADSDEVIFDFNLFVEKPRRWWPRNYGAQPLYQVEVTIYDGEQMLDSLNKTVGFRKIEVIGDMRFRINGVEIKQWGSAITPMYGLTHKWFPERGKALLDYAAMGNMNTLRLWGPGQPYHEEFYEYASKLGILIWQEFHTSGAFVPDLESFTDIVMEEARAEIRRLKHYPCIYMWCGGNEHLYMLDIFRREEKYTIGYDLLYYSLKDIVAEMDRSRYYHVSSPYQGRFPNEAICGDNHGSRAAQCFLPGEKYGHFFSENIRTFSPEIKSLKRFIPEADLWPEGYHNNMAYGDEYPVPDTWKQRTINNFEKKTGPYELFYDATDAESLVYRLNAAAAYDIREIITKQRQGKWFFESAGDRHCNGHLFWKLDTAWPQIYCSFIDYYLEPGLPYYMLRRCYTPVTVSIDVEDSIYIWGVNDTTEHFDGTVTVEVCELDSHEVTQRIEFPAGVPAGDSLILKSLDCFGHIQLRSVIHCVLKDRAGHIAAEDFQYLIAERRLPFADAKVFLRQDGDCVSVKAGSEFARCVELFGDDDGDQFGWRFEDNYFDLMPGQERKIKIHGNHRKGIITAKAHYAVEPTQLDWKRGR